MLKSKLSSLRMRLTLSHLAVIVVATGLSGLLLLSLLEQYFLEAMEQSLAAQARITAQALLPGAMIEEPADEQPAFNTIQQRASNLSVQTQNVAPPPETSPSEFNLNYLTDASLQLSSQLETRIRILDSRGALLVDSLPASPTRHPVDAMLVAGALAGQSDSLVEGVGREQAMHLALPVTMGERLVGVVYLSQPLSDALAVIHDLRIRWALSSAIALILSVLIGSLLSRAIARPLHQLTLAAGAVAGGNLEEQVAVSGPDELGRLGQAFNEMVRRLRAARQMQTDFVANVSHELRTPLTAIKGTVETLRDGAVDDPAVRDRFLGTVEDETDRLIRLVNDLLLLSRVDSEALNLQLDAVDMGQIIAGATDRFRRQVEQGGLAWRVKVDPSTPPALADADRIEQVMTNLLDNAIKYSHVGGSIEIHAGPESDGNIGVDVKDSGIGIPAEDLERIGERFYRADRARSRAAGGSGLGLAIARTLIEAHGGRLQISSTPGQGTTVTFTLPPAR